MSANGVTPCANGKHVVVIGAGGNIGSHLVAHLARLRCVGRVTLIDRDVYEEKNLLSQEIAPADVGRPKATMQARRLRRIRPDLELFALNDDVENVPLGRLRGDLLLGCLDSRRARQWVNAACWHLGIPWLDAGVEATHLLARIEDYLPGPESACLECAWGQREYELLEQAYACDGGEVTEPAPTNAPSALGALAASLLALESRKLLEGRPEEMASGKQVMVNALHHRHFVTAYRRNPRCRFDHEAWEVRPGGLSLAGRTLGDLLDWLEAQSGAGERGAVRVEGKRFVGMLCCPGCGRTRTLLRLAGRLAAEERRCACGRQMLAPGFYQRDDIRGGGLTPRARRLSLSRIGFRAGDIVAITHEGGVARYEL